MAIGNVLAGSTFAMMFVLGLPTPLRRRLPHHVYACWLLPAIALLPAVVPRPVAAALALRPPVPAVGPTGLGRPALLVWVIGAAVFLTTALLRYRRFKRLLARSAMPSRDAATWAAGGVRVLASSAVATPVAVGLLRPLIAVPPDFAAVLTPDERLLAIRHEAAHHERRDLLANLAALLVLSLHWPNPIAHLAYRRFRADQELSCDRTATRGLDPAGRRRYGGTLLRYAGRATVGGAVLATLNGGGELRLRIGALAVAAVPSPPRHLTAIAAAVLAAVALAAGWPPSVRPPTLVAIDTDPPSFSSFTPCSGIEDPPVAVAAFRRPSAIRLFRL